VTKMPRSRMTLTLVALLVLVVIGTASRDAEKEPDPAPTVTVTQTQTTELPAVVVTETVTEGSVEDDTGIEEESAAPEPEATQPSEDVYYDNCDEAQAAGDAPLYAGDPGYSAHLDRDGDGVACEPYAGP